MLACDMVLNTNHTNYQNWVSSAPTNKWLGIGCFYNSTQYAFDGTFDGQGHNIYGVYMDGAQDTQGTKNGRGFFNRAAGTIKNFRLRNSCIIGQQSMVGSIVGVAWRGAGAVSTSLNLDGVYSNAYVKSSGANHVVGGLVGTRNIPVSFNNCQFAGINNGSFNTNYRSDGGLLGTVDSKVAKVTVTNCAVTGVIKRDGNITAAATITGGTGGIVGKVTIGGSLSIEGCYINFATDDNSTLAGAIVQRTKTDYTIIFFAIWISFGVTTLIYSGSMSTISPEIVEAAQLDGITPLKEFLLIDVPIIWPTIVVFWVSSIAGIFVNQMHLYSFYGINASNYSIWTIGYYLYRGISAPDTTLADYPHYAAFGLLLTFITIPIPNYASTCEESYLYGISCEVCGILERLPDTTIVSAWISYTFLWPVLCVKLHYKYD